jgi:hypothetical protein
MNRESHWSSVSLPFLDHTERCILSKAAATRGPNTASYLNGSPRAVGRHCILKPIATFLRDRHSQRCSRCAARPSRVVRSSMGTMMKLHRRRFLRLLTNFKCCRSRVRYKWGRFSPREPGPDPPSLSPQMPRRCRGLAYKYSILLFLPWCSLPFGQREGSFFF